MIIEKTIVNNMIDEALKNAKNYIRSEKKDTVLYMSKSICVDGRFNYLNEIQKGISKLTILCMIPEIAKTEIEAKYDLKCINEPKEFSKGFFAYDEFKVSDDIKEEIIQGKYFGEYVNLKEYIQLGTDAALLYTFFAKEFLKRLFVLIEPKAIIMWNEFCGIHCIAKKICDEMNIPTVFFEFGVLPGSYAIDFDGQMGESYPAIYSDRFDKLQVYCDEILEAERIREILYTSGLNRKVQPNNNEISLLKSKLVPGRPVIFYAGQNDLDSGMLPYTEKTQKYHSPIFKSSYDAACTLAEIAKKNEWNFIYKPHPSRAKFECKKLPENVFYVNDININEVIDISNLTITILSQTSYVSLIRKRPVLMLGYNQLYKKGCVYQAEKCEEIEKKIFDALENGYTKEQDDNFISHIAKLRKYYLYDDLSDKSFICGKSVDDAVYDIELNLSKFPECNWNGWNKEESYVIWGSGQIASGFIKTLSKSQGLCAIIDNNPKKNGTYLYGIDIVSPDYLNENKNVKIIICCGAWKEVVSQLENMGYASYDDFIPYWIYSVGNSEVYSKIKLSEEQIDFIRIKRKIISFMGNCQINRILGMINISKSFYKEYFLLRLPLIQDLDEWQKSVGPRKNIFNKIDIMVSQPILETNKFSSKWSNKTIKQLLNPDCEIIIIPNLYFKGYYPQAGHYKMYYKGRVDKEESIFYNTVYSEKKMNVRVNTNIFSWGDKFIEELCEQGEKVTDIVDKLTDDNFLSREYVIENSENSIQELERRERESCDIVISDFIRENYKKYLLFYSERHPTYILVKELVKRIFEKIDFKDYSFDYYDFCQKDRAFSQNVLPIYPAVAKYLELEFDNQFFYLGRPYCEYPITLEEYIKMYIKTVYSNEYVEDRIFYYLDSMMFNLEKDNLKLYIMGNGSIEHSFLLKYPELNKYFEGFIDIEDPDMTKKNIFIDCSFLVVRKRNYNKAKELANNKINIYKVFDM